MNSAWLRPAAAVLLGLLAGAPPAPAQAPSTHPTAVTVEARALDHFMPGHPDQIEFGRVRFLGGLELKAKDRRFGGFSGMVLLDGGRRLRAISDEGTWLEATLEADTAGRPIGLADAQLAPVLGADGKPLGSKRRSDAEAMTLRSTPRGPELVVAFERIQRLLAFPLADGFAARARSRSAPAAIAKLPSNEGIEALAAAPAGSPIAGALVAIAERARKGETLIPAWIIGGPHPGTMAVEPRDEHDLTDAAFAPNGDLYILERRYRPLDGVRMRIRRVPAGDIGDGRTLGGEDLIAADLGAEIDNMEALAVEALPSGRVRLTLLSDDNFSFLQRTLLLRFEVLR